MHFTDIFVKRPVLAIVVSLVIFLTAIPISYYAARYGVDIDLLTRGAGFGCRAHAGGRRAGRAAPGASGGPESPGVSDPPGRPGRGGRPPRGR